MSLVLFEFGALQITARYLFAKEGLYYYRRRIPDDVRHLHPGKKGMLVTSLKTRDPIEAARKAHNLAQQHDALWAAHRRGEATDAPDVQRAALAMLDSFGLRPSQAEEYRKAGIDPDRFLSELSSLSGGLTPGADRIIAEDLPNYALLAANFFYGAEKPRRYLSDAAELFQQLKAEPPSSKSYTSRQAKLQEFIAHAGDLPIDDYRRDHVRSFITVLLEKGLKTDTVRRYLNYISPIFNVAIREYELNIPNVFEQQEIPRLGTDAKKRDTYTTEELRSLQAECIRQDDEIAWLDAIISDSGMRLGEVVGLKRTDLVLTGEVPFAWLRPNDVRPLKTLGSERKVPLVGISLWGAHRAISNGQEDYLFPRYASHGQSKSTVASNTLTKRHRALGIPKGAHSWRHTMRDRLRNVGASEEVADRIGGWAIKGVGQSYGHGHAISVLHEWMLKIVDTETAKLIRIP